MAERHQMRTLGRKSGADDATGMASAQESGVSDGAPDSGEMLLEEAWVESEPDAPAPPRFGWLAPTLALLTILGWTGFFGWTISGEVTAGAAPTAWAGWIVAWSVPTALVGVIWLLAMRSSRAEANRFAASAALLSRESAQLEQRLKVVNRELSLAREFLAAQSRELESLGRIAADRISTHAAELQQLIATNGVQVETIGTTSETALGNMNRLRDDLPVIANAARDVANQIGGAGNKAQDQLDRLVSGFARLGEFGTSSEAQIADLSARVDETLSGFDDQMGRIEANLAQRFVALQDDAEAYRTKLDGAEMQALGALRQRSGAFAGEVDALSQQLRTAEDQASARIAGIFAQLQQGLVEKLKLVDELDRTTSGDAEQRIIQLRGETERYDNQFAERARLLQERLEKSQAEFETREAQASELLAQRLAALDDALAQRREAQVADTEKLVAHGEAIAGQLDRFGALLSEVSREGDSARTSLASGFDALGEKLAAKRIALAQTEAQLAVLTESGVRLLEIIQSGARTSREDLQQAISTASQNLTAVEGRAGEVSQLMLRTSQQGSDLSDYLIKTRTEIDAADTAIDGFRTRLAEQSDEALARLQGLRGGFARLAEESGALAGDTQERLREALETLEAAIAQTFATLDEGTREKAAVLAQTIGGEAVQALERALRNESAATIGKLEQAAAHASGVGREAVIQLRDQLVRVNELTGNLEQRISRARELAEEQVNNDFSRRMALITDSLNSAAIDIAGALSTEVSDTAWGAYLKGDRGIFTRRAVRLIDNGAARDIAELYSQDDTFKTNVSRYIHDFEAMLRSTLSTRDGHVLSVTMLGSDMGKLYVVLAQSIQRFRN